MRVSMSTSETAVGVCVCVSELVSCPTLRVPAKASLDCTPEVGGGIGTDLHVCRLSCSAGSEFITTPAGTNTGDTTGDNITTWCGTQTGYRWLHQLQNITLPSCSGIYCHATCTVKNIFFSQLRSLWPFYENNSFMPADLHRIAQTTAPVVGVCFTLYNVIMCLSTCLV